VRTAFVALGILLLSAHPVVAAPPTLSQLFPAGGQRGQTVTVTATGSWSRWPVRAWCDGPEVSITAAKEAGRLEVKIAADALPIPRGIRIHDDEGASELRPFIVGGLPEVVEQEPNDDVKQPQVLAASTMVVNGRLAKQGDVDGFAVPLKKGQTLVASVEATRTLKSPMDAVLQIVSPDGFVLAQNDDHHDVDPHLAVTAPRDGSYIARVFAFPTKPDSSIRFAGANTFLYRLTLTTGPFADYPFPLALGRDKLAPVEIVGWNIPAALRQVTPQRLDDDRAIAVHPLLPQAAWLRFEPHATNVVTGPANRAKPMPFVLPATISGRFEQPGVHVFQFDAKKGQQLAFEIEARKLDSPLDPVLSITDVTGKTLAESQAKKLNTDPTLSYTVAATAPHRLEIRDLHDSAGPRHFYRLRASLADPDFTLTVSTDRFTISPGKTLEIPVTIARRNGFAEEINITVEGSPAGMKATPAPIKGTAKTASLKLAGDPVSGVPFRIIGRSAGGLVRVAHAPAAESGTTPHLWLTGLKAK
jgi:hypothetical protein